jgi:hypothetical protein
VDDIPVEVMRSQEFLKVETSGLLQELSLAGMGGVVVERDQDEAGQGDDLAGEFEDPGGSLDLSFEPVSGRTEPMT